MLLSYVCDRFLYDHDFLNVYFDIVTEFSI